MALFTGVQHLYTFNIVASLIYHLLPNVWKTSYSIRASILVHVLYWPSYSKDKFISCVVPRPSQWFFHFGKEIVIPWANIWRLRWMFQNLPLPAAHEAVTAAMVLLLDAMKNDEILCHQTSPFYPERWTKVVLQERAVVCSVYRLPWRCSITPSMSYATMNITFTTHCVGCTFFGEENRMLPFIWLAVQVWLVWATAVFVHSDDLSKKVVTFPLVLVQQGLSDCRAVPLLHLGNFIGIQLAATFEVTQNVMQNVKHTFVIYSDFRC